MKNLLVNLFVSYELAIIAKEKGFNEPCLSEFTILKDEQRLHLNNHFLTNEKIAPNVPAPTYQQIINWFRIEHGKIINVNFDPKKVVYFKYSEKLGYTIDIYDVNAERYNEDEYYKGLNEAIRQAFKILQ